MSLFNIGSKHKGVDVDRKYASLEGSNIFLDRGTGTTKDRAYFPLRYDEAPLRGFVDSADEAVFASVLERFERQVRTQAGNLSQL